MGLFKVSYIGRANTNLDFGEVYNVNRIVMKENGKRAFILDGIEGEYYEELFYKLQNRGLYYLANGGKPMLGNYLRLVRKRDDTKDLMTGKVRIIEKTILPGVYRVYTEKGIYDVATMK